MRSTDILLDEEVVEIGSDRYYDLMAGMAERDLTFFGLDPRVPSHHVGGVAETKSARRPSWVSRALGRVVARATIGDRS